MLSDSQLIALRMINVDIFCDPNTTVDFGRREMIEMLAKLTDQGKTIPRDTRWFDEYLKQLDAQLSIVVDNADMETGIILGKFLINLLRAPLEASKLESFSTLLRRMTEDGRDFQQIIRSLQKHIETFKKIASEVIDCRMPPNRSKVASPFR